MVNILSIVTTYETSSRAKLGGAGIVNSCIYAICRLKESISTSLYKRVLIS